MRILEVTPGYCPTIGGVERYVQAISERLAACGHQVTVATMQPAGQSMPDETLAGVQIRRFAAVGPGDAYRVPLGLLQYLRSGRNNWDIVHVHNYHAALIPLVALAGVRPFVVSTYLNDAPHSAAAQLLHVPYTLIGRRAVGQAEAVICLTEAERARVEARLAVAASRSLVIPCGVSDALLETHHRPDQHDPHLLLAVSRLHAYKRVEDAISIVHTLGAPYRLAVVGDGPHHAALLAHARALQITDRVQFVGKVDDLTLLEWYRRAGVVLAMSQAEAFGMTVLEGVTTGCQVVCRDIPAFRDLAAHFPGQITVVADVAQGAAAVRAAKTRTLVAPADITAFTWDAVTERTLDVYHSVVT